ncbi:MAG: zinc ABC transporter substrate-binding protein [bacterium]|nr:zinc ABC transporter substrate-binding protein [bacterium]
MKRIAGPPRVFDFTRTLFRAAAFLFLAAWLPMQGAERPLRLFSGIPPIAGLAERIGGDRVQAETLLRPGDNPHTFEPRPRQAAALGRSDLFLSCGFPFEERLARNLKGRSSGPVVAGLGAGLRPAPEPDNGVSSRHRDQDHDHGETDPHVWLSPPLLRILSLDLFNALKSLDPASESYFQGRLNRLLAEIDSLDRGIGQSLAPFRGRSFLAAHPSFGRFASAYGLKQMSVESEGKSPSARGLAAIVREARKERVSIVFTEPQFDPSGAKAVAKAIGGTVAAVDPLGRDALATIRVFSDLLARSFLDADAAGGARP